MLAELATVTHLSQQEWQDFLSLPPNAQELCIQGYSQQSWTQAPDTIGRVLAILGIIGTVAGVVSGVAGAASAVQGFTKLL